MIPKTLVCFLAAVLACPIAFAQKSGGKPKSEAELLKEIESLTPASAAAGARAKAKADAGPTQLFDLNEKSGDSKSAADKKEKKEKTEKKSKGPTEITALEATFDQKANVAVFIGNVVVVDPEFNVECDKLTATLKHEPKPAPVADASGKTTPKTATPIPAAQKPGEGGAKKQGGGLEKARAETTSGRRVLIRQDKVEADGSVTLCVGKADRADYDAVTGEIILTGSPEVQQGINRVIATEPGTVMTLKRDGQMSAKGAHKTIIVDKGESGL